MVLPTSSFFRSETRNTWARRLAVGAAWSLLAFFFTAQNISSRTAMEADFSSIDGIVKALYESITFREGDEFDAEGFRSLFMADAPFIRMQPAGPNRMNLDSFVESFKERIRTGALTSFYEAELSRKSESYGSIAQVFSTYEKGMSTNDPARYIRGINSLQLFHDGERWWIASIVWQDEQPDLPLTHSKCGPSPCLPHQWLSH